MSYTKHNFTDGKVLTARMLNEIEDGIVQIEKSIPSSSTTPTTTKSVEESFKGKIISILGDSISTFRGYIPVGDGRNLTHKAYYPQSYLTKVEDTWWHQLITDLGAKLGVNESWSGSFVGNTKSTNTVGTSNDTGPDTCMASITRITNLGSNGTPDLIFFYGGTNDAGKGASSLGETLGSFDSSKDFKEPDLVSTTWATFADAYKTAIMRLQYYYPTSRIIVLLPTFTQYYYAPSSLDAFVEVIREICDYFGVFYIDLRCAGLNYINREIYYGHENYIHPNPEGMTLLKTYIKRQLLSAYEGDYTENITYSITNTLSTLTNEKFYVKKVSKGASFTTTFTGSGLSALKVEMDGMDITSSVYNSSTGVVTIPDITGNIIFSEGSSSTTLTWYSNLALGKTGTNIAKSDYAGFAYIDATNNLYVGKPINKIRLRVAQEGTMTIGIANNTKSTIVDSTTITLKNVSSSIVQSYTLPKTLNLSTGQYLVFGATTDTGLFYYTESGSATSLNCCMYHHIPSAPAEGSGNAELTIDAGYDSSI